MELQQKVAAVLAADYSNVSESDADATVKELTETLESVANFIETRLTDIAVKYEMYVYIGEYGNGRHVVTTQREADVYGVDVGDWLSSSSTC